MNLLCIYPWLALGGADKFNLDMLGCLQRRGWRATVMTTLPSGHPWRTAFAPVCESIVDLTAYPSSTWPARLLALGQRSDAVLVSHSTTGYGVLPYLRAHLRETALVDYCHLLEPNWRNGGYPRISLGHGNVLDRQVVASQNLKDWMVAQGGHAAQIEVCTINIDAEIWDATRYDRNALRRAIAIAPNAPVVLYAGRLTRQKQPMLAAEVMRRVASQHPDVVFLVAGDGEYRQWLERFVVRHQLTGRVRLLGAVAPQRIRELLALSDLFFLPSENEGISLAIYEAMAMGVVPVGADVGGQQELVTPACGILVRRSRNETDDYTAALLRLLHNPILVGYLGGAARARVRDHFPLAAMGARMHTLLLDAQAQRLRDQRPSVTATVALAAAQRAVAAANTDIATHDQRWRARLRPQRVWQALLRRVRRGARLP